MNWKKLIILVVFIGLISLVGPFFLGGDSSETKAVSEKQEISFSKLGKLVTPLSNQNTCVALTCGDFDGDGDLDLAYSNLRGTIFFVENKMPQKNQNK